jgi:hypothetical protein
MANKSAGKATKGTDIHFLIWGQIFFPKKKKKEKEKKGRPGSHLLGKLFL